MKIDDLMQNLPENYSQVDRELVMTAYRVAEAAHSGQKRASGEPYVNHCIAVASILSEMRVPPETLAAGLLHDTVEDTEVTLVDLERDFGKDIAQQVNGVTKLTQLPRVSRGDQSEKEERSAEAARELAERKGEAPPEEIMDQLARSRKHELMHETLRKTFIAMGDDVRVVLIKLADRLHNMRTLVYVPDVKRRRIAQETLDIFAPLANRLGIWQMKWELEDLGFRYTNPEKYKEIAQSLTERRADREREMEEIIAHLKAETVKAGIRAEISGRPKHIYSIFRKMVRKGVPFDLVHDVRGIRIMVPDVPSCYTMLGIIHTHWPPIQGQFDDYIAVPKDNFYRSLHTAVKYDDGKTLEVQIRTIEMHQEAELGIAAHWRYKEGADRDDAFERRILWFRSLMDWQNEVNASEFVDSLKTDLFEERVYVFTPKGDVIDLASGSTPIDFAYHIHTDIGHRCRGAKVNGRLVSLDYHLKTGDQVEILPAKRGGPSRDWLNMNLGLVKTQRARTKIKHWFQKQARENNISQGRELLDREMHRLGLGEFSHELLAAKLDFRSTEDLLAAIGTEDITLNRIASVMMEGEKDNEGVLFGERSTKLPEIQGHDAIQVVGLKGLLTSIARCCNPLPGDDIVGYITRGRGATIHSVECPNVLRLKDRERLVRVSWGEPKRTYPVSVRIKAYDRDGLMRDVAELVTNEGISMGSVRVGVENTNKYNMADFQLILEVRDVEQLTRVLTRLEALSNVLEAHRMAPG